MAGSDKSGQDMEAGRLNQANDRTFICAEKPESDDDDDFAGDAVLYVEVLGGGRQPNHNLDGVVGTGYSASVAGVAGGTGVFGRGGHLAGTGVRGRGGHDGGGGIGVHGTGGPRLLPDAVGEAGPGVLGQGGRHHGPNREPHGAGVIGVAGPTAVPPVGETGGVGVFGRGADGQLVDIEGVPSGPPHAGIGVIGHGGVLLDLEPKNGAGVVGVAGGRPMVSPSVSIGSGVYGDGGIGVNGKGDMVGVQGDAMNGPGVHGSSDGGPGVDGHSKKSRGGRFGSDEAPQAQLVPRPVNEILPAPVTVTAMAIPQTDDQESRVPLPKRGQAGDLMTLIDDDRQCTLWFCVRGEGGGLAAKWAQVLLGPEFFGKS